MSKEETIRKNALAKKLRDEGKTYKEIGIALGGVSQSCVKQRIKNHNKKILMDQSWCADLSPRVTNILLRNGISSKEQALDFFYNNMNYGIKGLGNKSYEQITEWLGINDKKTKNKDLKIKQAINLLVKNGYIVTKS